MLHRPTDGHTWLNHLHVRSCSALTGVFVSGVWGFREMCWQVNTVLQREETKQSGRRGGRDD